MRMHSGIALNGGATLTVAAVDSLHPERADYRCDGVGDQVEINAAIAALPATGGKVYLMEGTFHVNRTAAAPLYYSILIDRSYVMLQGSGMQNTTIILADNQDCNTIRLSKNIQNVIIADLTVDGNDAGNAPPAAFQACCIRVGETVAAGDYCFDVVVERCKIMNAASLGIMMFAMYGKLMDSILQDNVGEGIEFLVGPGQAIGNIARGVSGVACHSGISIDTANQVIISDNVIYNEATGGLLRGCSIMGAGEGTIVANNRIQGCATSGLTVTDTTLIIIANNYIRSCGTTAISSNGGKITDNVLTLANMSLTFTGSYSWDVRGNQLAAGSLFTIAGSNEDFGPRLAQPFLCVLAYGTNNILGASGNGTYSATTQIDLCRNLVAKITKGTGTGNGQIVVSGVDQFGVNVSEAYTFVGGATATQVLSKIFATINTNGIVISGLTGTDTIELGVGNKLGLVSKIFTGAVVKCSNGTGFIPAASYTPDITYHGVDFTTHGAIAAGDVYTIFFLNCIA